MEQSEGDKFIEESRFCVNFAMKRKGSVLSSFVECVKINAVTWNVHSKMNSGKFGYFIFFWEISDCNFFGT